MNPLMTSTRGRDTHARLARRHGIDPVQALHVIGDWIGSVRGEISLSTSAEQYGCRLFYEDGLFEDLMLRLYRPRASMDGQLNLVLARISIAKPYRGKGYCRRLLEHLEARAEAINARFVVESANTDMGALLRSRQTYSPYDFQLRRISATADPDNCHWLFIPSLKSGILT